MIKIFKSLIIIIFFNTITLQANSETSWITKKSDKSKTEIKKVIKEDKSNNGIKKKEVKENKKKLKEKIKESKSWITEKSKEKVKDIKNNLKKHKTIDNLPKAEFYFAAVVKNNDGEDSYIYGYVNSDKKSSAFNFNNKSYYKKSDGIAYFENKENRCEVDSQIGSIGSQMMGEVVLQCKKGLKMTGGFRQLGEIGKGDGVTSNGDVVEFEFYTTKNKAIAKLEKYKNTELGTPRFAGTNDINLKPTGKYYALLIGNSKYTNWDSLTSPVNDVNEIASILKKNYNFEKVFLTKDADRDGIFKSFEDLSNITTENDYVLIYYAGHGDIKGNKSYWIPVDAKKKYSSNWINIGDIENYLQDIPAHHLAVMVDSCYFSISKGSNKITEEVKSKYYQKLLTKRARLVLSSGQNEPVDDTGKGNHSIFGISFIQSLKNNENAISLQNIGNNIAYAHSGMRQQPYLHLMMNWGHGGGDFIFIKKK